MTGIKWKRVVYLLLCIGVSCLIPSGVRLFSHGVVTSLDFGAVYYGSRCVIRHVDPYNPQARFHEFEAEGGKLPTHNPKVSKTAHTIIAVGINLPTALFLVSPLARLPWGVALDLWLAMMAGSFVVAGYLIWDFAANAPNLAGWMVCFILLNCEQFFLLGNLAGFCVCFCVIAVWCFLKDRFAIAGVLLLAVSLVLKPHDAGFVWLYFLLAGATLRKRALQTLGAVIVLAAIAALWIAPVSPHWTQELHRNLALVSSRGGILDPGPFGITSRSFGAIISLQSAISIFRDDPHFYNLVSYLICGVLILIWALAVLRKRASPQAKLLAIATLSFLTLLPVYHRSYDAKLLLLAIPGFTTLWATMGRLRWAALGLTSAAVIVTSDLPLFIREAATATLPVSASSLSGKLMLCFLQPAPVILLAAGCFYLWAFLSWTPPFVHTVAEEKPTETASV